MGGSMLKSGMRGKTLWRPLIGVIVAYAVAAQSLLIALGGFAPAANAQTAPAFAICHHDGQNAPELPAGNSDRDSCTHCIFCFAGSHVAIAGTPPELSRRVDVEIVDALWVADKQHLPRLPAYSIASPRGPPLRA
jgi:hypothetical protein